MNQMQQNVTYLVPYIFQYVQTRQCWHFITIVCKSWNKCSGKCMIGQLEENTYYIAQHAQIALQKGIKHLRFHIADAEFYFHWLSGLKQLQSLTLTSMPSSIDRVWLGSLLQCHYLHVKNLSVEQSPPNLKYLHLEYCSWSDIFPASLEFLHLQNRSLVLRDIKQIKQMPLLHLQHTILHIEQTSNQLFILPKYLQHTKKLEMIVPNFKKMPDFEHLLDVSDLTVITNVYWWSIFELPFCVQQLRSLTCNTNTSRLYEDCRRLESFTLIATFMDTKDDIESIKQLVLKRNPNLTLDSIFIVETLPEPNIRYSFI